MQEVDSGKERLVADARYITKGATNGLDRALQSICIRKTGREKRTHGACVDILIRLFDGDHALAL